ncbi:MAG: hypothetical protein ACJ75H_02635 [Thermoanaerobaculia bacterium]
MTEIPAGRPGPMPFLVLLDEALRQARRHFRAIYPRVAIPVALLATAVALIQASWFSRLTGDIANMRASFWNPAYIGLVAVYSLLLMIAYNTLQVAAVDAIAGRPIDMKRAWRFTIRGKVLLTLALWYLLTFAAMICCCLPAVVVGPLLAFVPAVMVDEGRFLADSLSRSADLTWSHPQGRWTEMALLKVIVLFVVGFLLAYLIGLLVSLPFQLPMYLDMFRKAAAGEDIMPRMGTWVWLQVPAQLLNALASTAIYLYLCFGTALLFFDTRDRKEGADLRSQIDSMFPGGEPTL